MKSEESPKTLLPELRIKTTELFEKFEELRGFL